jgi:hypothetical protein
MKHSLERLDDLVHDVINKKDEVLSENHPLFNWHEVFKREKENVKKYMRSRCLKLADKKKIRAFVDQCHTQVIALSDFVYLEDSSILLNTENSNSLSIMKGLQKLLSFVNYHFRDYVNTESKLPLYEIEILQRQLELEYKRIRKKLTGTEDEYLLDLLFLRLNQLTLTKEKFTLNLKYVSFFVEKLQEFIAHRKELSEDDYYLVDFLIAMNFNTWNLFQYVIKNIKTEVQKQTNIPEKLRVYTLFQKRLKQSFPFSNENLNPLAVTTKGQVLTWINEEVNSLAGGVKTEISTNPEVKGKGKVRLSISVNKLAVFLKAAKDCKLISMSDSEIARYVNENFQTVSGIIPSEKSFLNKFYQLETASLENTLEILDKMSRKVKSYLNPS